MAIQGGNLFGVTDHNVSLVGPFDGDYRSAFEAVNALHKVTDGGINAFIDRLEAGDSLDQAFQNTTQDIVGTELAGAGGFVDFSNTAGFINWFNTGGAVLNNYLTTSTDFTAGSGAITAGGSIGSSSNLTLDQTITNGTGVATVNTHFTLNFTNSAGSSGSDIIFQVGANTGQSVNFRSQDLRTSALGLTTANIATQSGADTAISAFGAATDLVSRARSYFGAVQNRLEHTIANLTNAEENLTSSESRIRDLDMAKEMVSFQKTNILAQAAQAMLAQANQQPQSVLQLIP
ncbi:flagellin [Desulfosporosinus lacus]|nr:flagellin [Desulfosporosinus lacus]